MTARICILSLLVFSGCVSDPEIIEPSDLDLKPQLSSEEMRAEQRMKDIAKRKAFNWQTFFRSAPNEQDKKNIQRMLDSDKSNQSYDALMKRGHNYLSIGKIKDAEIAFRQANRADESQLEPILEIARIHLRRNEAKECFNYLAQIKEQLNKIEEPEESFVFRYRYLLAMATLKSRDFDTGRAILRDLITIQPNFAPGYVSLATSYLQESNTQAAEFIINRGIDRCKEDANFYSILGAIAKRQGRSSVASHHFNKALEMDENNVLALINRSTMAIETHEFERAELDIKKALAIEPDNDDALITLAIIERKTGRLPSAKGTLERAIELNPTGSMARFHLANMYLHDFDDVEYALQLFYEVLQTRDGNESVRQRATTQIQNIKQRKS